MSTLERAIEIAKKAHEGQVDKPPEALSLKSHQTPKWSDSR